MACVSYQALRAWGGSSYVKTANRNLELRRLFTVFQDDATDTPRNKGGNKHISVEHDPHETRSKTS